MQWDENNTSLSQKIDQSYYMNFTMKDWRELLSREVNVYVYNNSYVAKRFDSINYEFCGVKEATEILQDNLYALLKYKYFPYQDDNIDKLINKIVKTFTENLKTTLIKISFEWEQKTENKVIKELPISCVAFKNGVYDFDKNKWLFKICSQPLQTIQNTYYTYNNNYLILWYINIDFEDLSLDVKNLSSKDIKELFYKTTGELNNLAFNLIYNMSFNEDNVFSLNKFEHLCEILGYTLSSQFIQNFVLFIGTGSNGKNSLLDGCLSAHLYPRATSISLDSIEEDRFITGALENRYHNFFLESTGKTYYKTEMLKQLTGSTMQSVERKGENKRSGYINVKNIFSANNRDKIKFGDSTKGFLRRINLYEVFYQWDSKGDYLKLGNYLKTNISPDLRELKQNNINTITYIYLGMWGLCQATGGFKEPFYFTYNDYNTKYENINGEVKKLLTGFTIEDIIKIILQDGSESAFYVDGKRLYMHPQFKRLFRIDKDESWKKCVNDEELLIEFLEDKNVWINLNQLKSISSLSKMTQAVFNSEVLKYTKSNPQSYFNNQKYVELTLIGRRVKFKK